MKYGLVLAGGGGKGAYQIGVYKALREIGIELEAVAGTSVGALNGALIAQDSFDKALELWSNINVDQVMKVDPDFFKELINPNISDLMLKRDTMVNHIGGIIKNKGFDISPLIELLSGLVDEAKIRNSHIDFGLVTVSLTDHKPLEYFIKDIPEGKLLDYMLASSYLPCFSPMQLDGKRFIDGGFYNNFPVDLMVKKGIKNIIAVDLHAVGRKKHTNVKNINYIYIEPSGDTGKMLDFDAARSKYNIQMGYLDTLRAFGHYHGDSYYFIDYPNDEAILSIINRMDSESVAAIFELLNLKLSPTKRNLLEKAMPRIFNIFGCSRDASYADLFIKILEYLADILHIERLEPYYFNKLVEIIQADMIAHEPDNSLLNALKSFKDNLIFTVPRYNLSKFILSLYFRYNI